MCKPDVMVDEAGVEHILIEPGNDEGYEEDDECDNDCDRCRRQCMLA